jgi:hypothetical protein
VLVHPPPPSLSTACRPACPPCGSSDAASAAVAITGATSNAAAPIGSCSLIKGDSRVAQFKRRVTKANGHKAAGGSSAVNASYLALPVCRSLSCFVLLCFLSAVRRVDSSQPAALINHGFALDCVS